MQFLSDKFFSLFYFEDIYYQVIIAVALTSHFTLISSSFSNLFLDPRARTSISDIVVFPNRPRFQSPGYRLRRHIHVSWSSRNRSKANARARLTNNGEQTAGQISFIRA